MHYIYLKKMSQIRLELKTGLMGSYFTSLKRTKSQKGQKVKVQKKTLRGV